MTKHKMENFEEKGISVVISSNSLTSRRHGGPQIKQPGGLSCLHPVFPAGKCLQSHSRHSSGRSSTATALLFRIIAGTP